MDKRFVVENLVQSLKGNLKALKEISGGERVSCWLNEKGRLSGFAVIGQNDERFYSIDFYEDDDGILKLEVY